MTQFTERDQLQTLFATEPRRHVAGQASAVPAHDGCEGCRARPDPFCAACGAPASIWTEAGDGRHAVAWCATCHDLLVSGRPANAAPLEYLTLHRLADTA